MGDREQDRVPSSDVDWSSRKPSYYTDTHAILLKEFWKEGMTPTPMMLELRECIPTLSPVQCREIVCYWMWSENLRMR